MSFVQWSYEEVPFWYAVLDLNVYICTIPENCADSDLKLLPACQIFKVFNTVHTSESHCFDTKGAKVLML